MDTATFVNGELLGPDGDELAWPGLALFGDPVDHSLSPRLHRAALAARGIDGSYEAIRIGPADLGPALGAAARAGVRGVNLTAPLKELALGLAERATDECTAIGATNTLVSRPGGWTAHNTDARGLAMALERDLGAGLRRQARRCVVLGAGGAARAAVVALVALGAGEVRVVARSPERARWAARLGVAAGALADEPLDLASLVVNCTPVGFDPEAAPPIFPGHLNESAYLLDLTYGPRPSALARGFAGRSQDGRAMLVAQAALAFSVWYGALPPLAEMAAAIGIDW